jgi:hypothetical protein
MFFQKSDLKVQNATLERRIKMHILMRSYVENDCKRSQTYINYIDLEKEIDDRLAKLFS